MGLVVTGDGGKEEPGEDDGFPAELVPADDDDGCEPVENNKNFWPQL